VPHTRNRRHAPETWRPWPRGRPVVALEVAPAVAPEIGRVHETVVEACDVRAVHLREVVEAHTV